MRAAARKYGVSRTALQRHLGGRKTAREAHEKQKKISPSFKGFLVRWVKQQTKLGFNMPHSRFCIYALKLSEASGGPQVSKHTRLDGLKQHPELKTLRSVCYDWRRANAAYRSILMSSLIESMTMSAIPPEHTYNADEIGSQIGIGHRIF